MASAWRVVAFFVVVFVVPVVLIVVPLHARYSRYPSRAVRVVTSDTLDLHAWASSFWCQGQRVTANTSLSAYLLPEPPSISPSRRRVSRVTDVLGISEVEPDYHLLHLLRGSEVALAACSRWPGAQIIVVKGEENFKKCFYREDRQLQRFEEIRMIKSRNLDGRMLGTTQEPPRVKAIVKGVMAIGNEDVFEDEREEPNHAGEVFDEDLLKQDLKKTKNITLNDGAGNNFAPNTTSSSDSSNITVSSQNLTKNETDTTRLPRSIISTRNPDDGSDEKTKLEGEAMERSGIVLHSIDDTRDVTAGNSSMSSSEEFMEDCLSTLAMINISSSRNCQDRNVEIEENMYNFSINETGDYYFIFMSDNTIEENVMKYYMKIDRAMFSVDEHLSVCNATRECSLPLGFLSRQAVAVEVSGLKEEELGKLEAFEVQVVCQPRVAVYMVFILLVPFILMFFAFQ